MALKAQEVEESRLELVRLRDLLDLRDSVPWATVAARVIARAADGSARIVTLDRGSRAGVRVNMPVLTPRGIVGRVIEAAPGASKIQTILDPNSGVAGLIQRTRVQGMIETLNPAAERAFGYRGADLVGRDVRVLLGEDHEVVTLLELCEPALGILQLRFIFVSFVFEEIRGAFRVVKLQMFFQVQFTKLFEN